MKVIAIIAVFLGMMYGGFKIDQWLFYLIIDEIPQTEWLGIIKIVVGFVLFLCTAGIIIWLSGMVTAIASMVFQAKSSKF